jgi:hypothetical protein
LWVADGDGANARRLVGGSSGGAVSAFRELTWAPDDRAILFDGAGIPSGGQPRTGAFVVTISGGEPVLVGPENTVIAWLPGSR